MGKIIAWDVLLHVNAQNDFFPENVTFFFFLSLLKFAYGELFMLVMIGFKMVKKKMQNSGLEIVAP